MVKSCAAFGCTNRAKPCPSSSSNSGDECSSLPSSKKTFHRFPLRSNLLLKKWLDMIKRKDWMPTVHSWICSDHFEDHCYDASANHAGKRLKPDAVPTIFEAMPKYLQVKKKRERTLPVNRKQERQKNLKMDHAYTLLESRCPSAPSPCTSSRTECSKTSSSLSDVCKLSDDLSMVSRSTSSASCSSLDTSNRPTSMSFWSTSSASSVLPPTKGIITPRKKKLLLEKKTLQQKVRRKIAKINKMSDLKEMRRKNFVDNSESHLLENNFGGLCLDMFRNELANTKRQAKGRRYADAVKEFAPTMYFYSPRAYNYLRTVFHLPHHSSIKTWTASVNCGPGFLLDVFSELQAWVQEGRVLSDCGLVIDGMAIRKQIQWNATSNKFEGHVDYGKYLTPEDDTTVASEALVFMLVGTEKKWKTPVGYFLTDKSTASTQAIRTCLGLAADHGLRVWTLTLDGAAANVQSLKILGCRFGMSYKDIKADFKHPSRDYYVHALLDACHMLKLARNCLADLKVLQLPDGTFARWMFIELLHRLQENEGFSFANKITSKHVQWTKQKMKVAVAAQTISSSVANALDFLDSKMCLPEFSGSAGTVSLLLTVDKLFDILNSRTPFGKGYKQPIRINFLPALEAFFEETGSFLINLKTGDGKTSLLCHRRKTFILGFILCMKSVLAVSKELLTRSIAPLKYVLSYKFSQDHLETFFSCIRARGGFNNNPNSLQFKWAMRRLLLHNSVKASVTANCLEFTEESGAQIFSLKSSKRAAPISALEDAEGVVSSETDHVLTMMTDSQTTVLRDNVLYYIAGYIIRKIMPSISCLECASSLLQRNGVAHEHNYARPLASPQYTKFTIQRDNGGLLFASDSVYRVIKSTELHFKTLENKFSVKLLDKRIVSAVAQSLCTSEHVFPDIHVHAFDEIELAGDSHKLQLIRQIASKYLTVRLHAFSKRFTNGVVKKNVASERQKLTKLILFKNL